MTTSFTKIALATLMGLAAWGASGPSSAAIVTGNWDPPFEANSPLAGLGWTATVNLFVPNECVTGGVLGGVVFNGPGFSFGCGGLFTNAFLAAEIKVVSAEIGIYDVATGGPNALLDVIRFDPASLPIQILGFDASLDEPTFYIGGTSSAVAGGHARTADCQFRLSLNDANNPPFGDTEAPFVSYACGGAPTFTRSNTRPDAASYSVVLNDRFDDATAAAVVTQTRLEPLAAVPEPASLALAGLALAAAGVAAGRRRRAPAASPAA